MSVTWRGAFLYALTVAVLSWLVGMAVDLALLAVSDGSGGWGASAADPWGLAFPAAATVALALARRFLQPLPRWRVIVTDGVLYTVVLLVCAALAAWAAGDEAPIDSAFVTGIFALFSLQLPAGWGLCAWRSGHLEVVLTSSPSTEHA
ncbi:hypothetical protein ABZ397_03970 [Streptomyces sp. NPDC005876]|uniref:hypothetical protein n=1 Tax=Streptomyces sp. NPDC005876 TaxID=3157076 RepID=UPI0033C1B3B0